MQFHFQTNQGFTWIVKNRYAYTSIGVDIGVKHVPCEPHFGGTHRVVCGEGDDGGKHSILVHTSLWSSDVGFPLKEVVFVFGSRYYSLGGLQGQLFILVHQSFQSRSCHCNMRNSLLSDEKLVSQTTLGYISVT